ncbi:hypothetical protein HGRIS_009911 [Hohenbuehelia grisea]|uniref:Uncharacterized protein n=1 Tax=Hohenbuehelia grisea TaxID=104357 RepID=A0ABR3J2P5_9AGAR
MNDKNMQLQKQLENVVREANGEINILTTKVSEVERDLELERRKVRDLQEASRERDKEYQKLKAQFDKIKRKALLAPSGNTSAGNDGPLQFGGPAPHQTLDHHSHEQNARPFGTNMVEAAIGDMHANGMQRTPLVDRPGGGTFVPQTAGGQFVHRNTGQGWMPGTAQGQQTQRNKAPSQPQRMPFERSGYRSGTASGSESTNEVENILMNGGNTAARREGGWNGPSVMNQGQRLRQPSTAQRVFATTARRPQQGVFRPAQGIR